MDNKRSFSSNRLKDLPSRFPYSSPSRDEDDDSYYDSCDADDESECKSSDGGHIDNINLVQGASTGIISQSRNDKSRIVLSLASNVSSDSEGDHYIFTDDEASSSPAEELSEAEALKLNNDMAKAIKKEEERRRKWADYNQNQGRRFAQELLQKAREGSTDSVESDSEEEDYDYDSTVALEKRSTSRRRKSRKKKHRGGNKRTSFIGRAVQKFRRGAGRKKYTKSTSPLDNGTLAGSSSRSTLSSPSTRNALADFGSWEARVAAAATPPRHNNKNSSTTAKAKTQDNDDDGSVFTVEETSFTLDGDDNFQEIAAAASPAAASPSTPVRATSLKIDIAALMAVTPPRNSAVSFEEASQALESRASSDEICDELELGEEGHELLAALRGKTGIIDPMDDDDDEYESAGIPWIELFQDLWVPHYEEYVVRAVNAFAHKLLG